MNDICMRGLALLLETPIITITAPPLDTMMTCYPPSASPFRIVPEQEMREGRRAIPFTVDVNGSSRCMNNPQDPQGVRLLTAIDVAFEPDTLVLMYSGGHYYPTRLSKPSTHNPDVLRTSFRENGHKIFKLEIGTAAIQ